MYGGDTRHGHSGGRGGHARGGGQGYDGLPKVGELYCTYKFTNATS